MITHEEARELASKALLYGLEEVENDKLVRYISQQEKVTELLELYEKKSDLLVQIASGKYLQDDYMKLLEKIDNLQKELEEMK